MNGVLKSFEETLADVQRVDAKAQSALDLKKQNLKDETKKRKELVKSMEEVMRPCYHIINSSAYLANFTEKNTTADYIF